MKKNYEIKCKLSDPQKISGIRNALKNYSHTAEIQKDIYFRTVSGRLKLRVINDKSGSLILYSRAEKSNKRISNYIISKTNDFRELEFILRKQFEVIVTVIKKRNIFINKNIRVHLDNVRGLGKFLEIEIIYDDFSSAKRQMKKQITMLDLDANNFIKGSYSDLLINFR